MGGGGLRRCQYISSLLVLDLLKPREQLLVDLNIVGELLLLLGAGLLKRPLVYPELHILVPLFLL